MLDEPSNLSQFMAGKIVQLSENQSETTHLLGVIDPLHLMSSLLFQGFMNLVYTKDPDRFDALIIVVNFHIVDKAYEFHEPSLFVRDGTYALSFYPEIIKIVKENKFMVKKKNIPVDIQLILCT